MRVAIQGIRGSFHDQAAQSFFDEDFSLVECRSFRDVFTAVTNDTADYGIIAVENSLHGSINPVYRLLAEKNIWVCGEVRLQIAMCLIGTQSAKDLDLSQLNSNETTVMSHFAAFGQCEQWLADNLPVAKQLEVTDTAEAVRQVIEEQDTNKLAIASAYAANMHGGTILQTNINDDPNNYTRFFVIRKERVDQTLTTRTSIILREPASDKAGTLYDALGVFAKLGINLSKLDSHPRPGEKRSYYFYIDFDTGLTSETGETAIAQLNELGWNIQILGTYLSSSTTS